MKYYKINEFQCRCGCAMPAEVRQNIEALVENVLDPVREAYGKPIYVNSGYRCEAHNRKVGGVPRSQHIVGEAADVRPVQGVQEFKSELEALARIIKEQGRFDQLIIYPTFLHVSYKRSSAGSGANRHKVLRKTATGYAAVPHTEAI